MLDIKELNQGEGEILAFAITCGANGLNQVNAGRIGGGGNARVVGCCLEVFSTMRRVPRPSRNATAIPSRTIIP